MAIYLHGVSESDVVEQYPRARQTAITETSAGVSLPMVRTYRDQAAATVNTALEQHGYTDIEAQLTDNARAMTSAAIIAYCVAQLLLRVGGAQEAAPYLKQWDDALLALRKWPEYLGAAQLDGAQVHSNIDLNTPSRKSWGKGFKGW